MIFNVDNQVILDPFVRLVFFFLTKLLSRTFFPGDLSQGILQPMVVGNAHPTSLLIMKIIVVHLKSNRNRPAISCRAIPVFATQGIKPLS